ncbi:WD40-repeat-containing domain protein [Baffinella frigidus]|nr:WD40-repeat-containing domain protein [Cryptophyta sp. CCMP2293]
MGGAWSEHVTTVDVEAKIEDVGMGMSFNHVTISSDEVPTSAGGGIIRLFDASSMKEIYQLSGHSAQVNACAFSQECDLLASCSDDCSLRLWKPPDYDNANRVVRGKGACLTVMRGSMHGYKFGHSEAVTQCDFTPDGVSLISASDDTTVKIWDHRWDDPSLSLSLVAHNLNPSTGRGKYGAR